MIQCITVDDEPLALEILRKYIKTLKNFELVKEFTKSAEAFTFLNEYKVDLLFIDIKMPVLTGLTLAKTLNNPPKIIFTTAFREYALEGFDVQALDYLLKPISYDRFLKAFEKYYSITKPNAEIKGHYVADKSFVFVKVDREMIKLNLNEICYVEALKNYVRIKTVNKDIITYHTLSYMEDKLPINMFQRIHKSYLINLQKIEKYTAEFVVIYGKELPLGKTYFSSFISRLQKNSF